MKEAPTDRLPILKRTASSTAPSVGKNCRTFSTILARFSVSKLASTMSSVVRRAKSRIMLCSCSAECTTICARMP